ncbi:hypothetical protein [Lysinibacillus sp. 54212]|uniref:hypothetical protein n=1 Tax=Lysinibacillus sp. 54212 TaxID=3119829 RepID=UPI002FC60221
MNNRLIQSFLQDPKMDELYQEYLINPTNDKKICIEQHFKEHVKKMKILSYFSKVLFFEAQRFDRKIRYVSNKNPLILDGDDSIFLEIIASQNDNDSFDSSLENAEQLQILFEDKHLFNIISNLNSKNKELLYLLYVKEMNEAEVANCWGVSQQAINKKKKSILKKIRVKYKQERGEK